MRAKKVKIIALASVSGGGKTFVTIKLKNHLNNASVLHFDDYDFEGPQNLSEWAAQGADYNAWHLEPLIEDIQKITEDNKSQVEYLILDYPFAYQHDKMSQYIDFTIFIDSPLDIALARRILRDCKEQSFDEIQKELHDYLFESRHAYLVMLQNIKPNSDFVVDGSLDIDVIIEKIDTELHKLS